MNLSAFTINSRNVERIYLIRFLTSMLFFVPILALYLKDNLFNLTNVTLILSISAISKTIFEIPSGVIADLFGRKKTIIIAILLMIISVIFLYIGQNIVVLSVYALLFSFGKSLKSGTDKALIYDTLKEEGREYLYKKAIGIAQAVSDIGKVLGSLISTYIILVSLSFSVLMTLIPLIIALILSFTLKEPFYDMNKNSVVEHVIKSVKCVITNKSLIIILLGYLVVYAVMNLVLNLGPLFYTYHNIDIKYLGFIAAAIFTASSVGYILSHYISNKIGDVNTLIISSLLMSVFMFIATLSSGITSALLLVFLSFFSGIIQPIIEHVLNLEIDSYNRATINSIASMFGTFGLAVFLQICNYFAQIYNIEFAFRLSSVMLLIAPTLFLFLIWKVSVKNS